VSEDPTSPDAVARSMGLGGGPAPERPAGGRAGAQLAPWRGGPVRALVAAVALTFGGYVFSWGDVEEESRAVAAIAGGIVFGALTLVLGTAWWLVRLLAGRRRPYFRTAFNYGLVAGVTVLAILGADEFLG
jgi:hypothetical protein